MCAQGTGNLIHAACTQQSATAAPCMLVHHGQHVVQLSATATVYGLQAHCPEATLLTCLCSRSGLESTACHPVASAQKKHSSGGTGVAWERYTWGKAAPTGCPCPLASTAMSAVAEGKQQKNTWNTCCSAHQPTECSATCTSESKPQTKLQVLSHP